MSNFWNVACVALLATSLLAGCGGGSGMEGGDDGATDADSAGMDDGGDDVTLSDADFVGTYQLVALRTTQTDALMWGDFGTHLSLGMGSFSRAVGVNDNGTVTPITAGPNGPYTVAADGTMTLDGRHTGGLSADGSVALLSRTSSGNVPGISVLMRRSGAYDAAMLSGSYHSGQYTIDLGSPVTIWTSPIHGIHQADGAGTMVYARQELNGLGFSGELPSGVTNSYAVAPDGVLTLQFFRDEIGAVTPDGSFVIAGGAQGSPAPPMLHVMVKASSGMTAASFSGEYWVAGMLMTPNGTLTTSGPHASFSGTATVDGAGSIQYVLTQNSEAVVAPAMRSTSYTVADNGQLESGSKFGGVTADGKYAFLCGGRSAGSVPAEQALFIFVRK